MFDEVYNRKGTGSYKWDTTVPAGVIENGAYPLSVADMEFKAPREVREAIKDFTDKGFFCYTDGDEEYREAVKAFMLRRHNYKIKNEWITCVGGVVCAINTAVRAFTKPGEGVIIQSPVYYPFGASILNNGRKIADNPLVPVGDTYKMNFDELEKLAKRDDVKLMLLCSPHNPAGRVWTKAELLKVGEICLENGVTIVSDEIHFDIVRKEHTVFTNADSRFLKNTVICTAVSKSFNLAGLGTSNIIIADKELRDAFQKQLAADGYTCINCVSRPATLAAYNECDYWLDAVNEYITENLRILSEYIGKTDKVKMFKCEGTYLAWLNMSLLNMSDEKIELFLRDKCGIIEDPGFWFGEGGKGFARINVACPRSILIEKLEKFVEQIALL